MTKLRPWAAVLVVVAISSCGALQAVLATGGGPPAPAAPAGRAGTVNYMNKTSSAPNIDTNWDAAAWQKGKVYDLSMGQGKCLMYIMFTAASGASTRLFIGIDFIGDTSATGTDMLLLGFDGDNDGKITYENTDPNGTDAGVVWPMTMGGPCVDRWAQLWGGTYINEAGWLNTCSTTFQMWRVSGGYESGDGLGTGFSGHRFYEYSTDYSHNLGLGDGPNEIFGLTVLVQDAGGGGGTYQLPINRTNRWDSWASFALAQSPEAIVRSPLPNGYYYKGDEVPFDGADSTDDEPTGLRYLWTFDDGSSADTRLASRAFNTTGRHTATLEVTDSDGLKGDATVVFFIKEKNVAPAIATYYPLLDPLINETESITFEVGVLDLNMDQGVGETVWVNWTLDDKRVRTGIAYPSSNYTFKTAYDGPGSAGVYYVNVSVQDTYEGGWPEPTVHRWVVTVNNLNRPPLVTVAEPDVDQLSVAEGGDITLRVEYLDPDGDNVTAQWYADNETLAGTRNRPTITWQPDFNSSGAHELKVALTDRSGGLTERAWTVLVNNVDRPPAITSASPSQAELSVKEGSDIRFTIVKFDPDMEPLSAQWYIDTTPVPGSNSTSFQFNATYEGALSSEGSPYTIKVVVRDPFGQSADRSWQLTVEEVNRLPVAIIDSPLDEEDFGLGDTVKVRGDRSWDPDAADNGSLVYLWDFGDGKTGSGPSGSHKYDKTGPYTIRLTVRDRTAASSAFVHINIRAPVLWVTDILVPSATGLREDRAVNITVRLSNTGDADAKDVLVKLSVDNIPVATLSLPELLAGEREDLVFSWTAVRGEHTLRASISPAPSFIVPDGSASEKAVTVKAKPQPVAEGPPAWMAGAAVAFAAALAAAMVGWFVMSRRRKAARPAAARATDGRLSPQEALAALTRAPSPYSPAPLQAPSEEAAPFSAGGIAPEAGAAPESFAPQVADGSAPLPQPEAAPEEIAAAGAAAEGAASVNAPAAIGQAAGEAPESARAAQESAAATVAVPDGAPAPPAPAVVPVCGSCGEPLEAGWKACPACGARFEGPVAPPPAPEAAAPVAAPPSAFSEETAAIRKRIEVLTAMDKDVSALQSTLDLAASFHRTGKEDKAQKYLEKAREMLAALDSS